jgi:hypothetical protein
MAHWEWQYSRWCTSRWVNIGTAASIDSLQLN